MRSSASPKTQATSERPRFCRWDQDGKRHTRYFGVYGSAEASKAYTRFSAQWVVGQVKPLIAAEIWDALRAVEGLKRGRCREKESLPVRPAWEEQINAVLEHFHLPYSARSAIRS